jgi:hypothetical protein
MAGSLAGQTKELRTVDLFIDKAVFDLDVIAVVGNFRDVHFGHRQPILKRQETPIAGSNGVIRTYLAAEC